MCNRNVNYRIMSDDDILTLNLMGVHYVNGKILCVPLDILSSVVYKRMQASVRFSSTFSWDFSFEAVRLILFIFYILHLC